MSFSNRFASRLTVAAFCLIAMTSNMFHNALAAPQPLDLSWTSEYSPNTDKLLTIGIVAAVDDFEAIAEGYAEASEYMKNLTGVDFAFMSGESYADVIDPLVDGDIQFALLGASGYVTAYLQSNGTVEPILTAVEEGGVTGYYSIVVVRCDSGIESLDDLAGKTIAFADPDSTSGFAVPYYSMVHYEEIDPAIYFENTTFSGSHETGVLDVRDGIVDAAATFSSGDLTMVTILVAQEKLDEDEVCTIWTSPEIFNGPFTAGPEVTPVMIRDIQTVMERMVTEDPIAFDAVSWEDQVDWVEVDHFDYEPIVGIREWLSTFVDG
jgi:phosphonate transport system substrate-binding protein